MFVADYTQRIGKKAFGAVFRKAEPSTERREGSHLEWAVIAKETLAPSETRSHVVARSRLYSRIRNLSREVKRAAKTRGLRDYCSNLAPMLIVPCIPLTTNGQNIPLSNLACNMFYYRS